MFENTYFSFFSDFKKNMTFYVFLKWLWKKRKKSVAKILSSMMVTLLQKKKKSFLNVYRNFGLKTLDVVGTYRRLSHMQFSLHTFLCPHFWARCLMLVTVTYRYCMTSGNWVIKCWVIKWPVKLRTFFYVFFSKSKNTWLCTFFWVADYVFSNTAIALQLR